MALFSKAELERLSRQHSAGLSSAAIVTAVQAKGARFSEATLRKYVQIGLLPKSQRVGARGRNRGSVGVYPVVVLRLINDIKRAIDDGERLEDLRMGTVGLGGELHVLRASIGSAVERFAKAVERAEPKSRRALGRELAQVGQALDGAARKLEKFASRLARRQVAY